MFKKQKIVYLFFITLLFLGLQVKVGVHAQEIGDHAPFCHCTVGRSFVDIESDDYELFSFKIGDSVNNVELSWEGKKPEKIILKGGPTPSCGNCTNKFAEDLKTFVQVGLPNEFIEVKDCEKREKVWKAAIPGSLEKGYWEDLKAITGNLDIDWFEPAKTLQFDKSKVSTTTIYIIVKPDIPTKFYCLNCDTATFLKKGEAKFSSGKALGDSVAEVEINIGKMDIGNYGLKMSAEPIGLCAVSGKKTKVFDFVVLLECNKITDPIECKNLANSGCEWAGAKCREKKPAGTAPTDKTKPVLQSAESVQSYYSGYYATPEGYRDGGGALPDCAFSGTCRDVNDLLGLIINFGSNMFAIIGSFAFAFFVYGGFTILSSFGNAERVKKGKDIMVAAVVGMVISLSAFLLVDFMLNALGVEDSFKATEFRQ